ncbi:MAG: PilZ domain-containing protein [Desulfobacterales bacterium]|jgi:Tfp pilus assembly protein PilZ
MKPTGKDQGSRYNVTLSRLMELVVGMSEDQQLILLQKAEQLTQLKGTPLKRPPLNHRQDHNERRFPRKPCSIIVNFTTSGRAYTSAILDISVDGVFIQTKAAFDRGDEISMAFSYPDFPDVFRIHGIVRRVTPRGIGVQFHNITHSQRSRIKALLDWIKGLAI